MKRIIALVSLTATFLSCGRSAANAPTPARIPITGTWKLLTGTVIDKGDTVVTDYTGKVSFIKIINNSHFAFLQHDLSKGKDSVPVFASGGGTYSLQDSLYTEHLEYCSDRQWENNHFTFTVEISNDTLVQNGIEQVESAGINRKNTERYVRVK